MKFLSTILVAVLLLGAQARAARPFLQANDVIALVGGEDMVAAAEQGQLELMLVRELPRQHLKFRSLAWEGDTVFEQPRDLNYPTLEQQLDEVGATVVMTSFGLNESAAGKAGIPKFIAAYEKLLDRFGKRRLVLVLPGIPPIASADRAEDLRAYGKAITELARRREARVVPTEAPGGPPTAGFYRSDKLHLNEQGQRALAARAAAVLCERSAEQPQASTEEFRLADAIRAKNKMWYHYFRPQNWAFLNGDRTIQPSSRDHLDPSKRWFPEEMKEWLPLIAQKEEEIWRLAGGR